MKQMTFIFAGIIVVVTMISAVLYIRQRIIHDTFSQEYHQVIVQNQIKPYDHGQDEVVGISQVWPAPHDLSLHKNQKNLEFEDLGVENTVDLLVIPQASSLEDQSVDVDSTQEYDQPSSQSYMFVTMPIDQFLLYDASYGSKYAQNCYKLDVDTQESFDILLGNDFNRFINLVLQSNNDIVTEQACRSCVLYTLFKKVKHRKPLREQEIKTLQLIIEKLYHYMSSMKQLTKKLVMSREQYNALQDLNQSHEVKQKNRLQARQAYTKEALRALRAIEYH